MTPTDGSASSWLHGIAPSACSSASVTTAGDLGGEPASQLLLRQAAVTERLSVDHDAGGEQEPSRLHQLDAPRRSHVDLDHVEPVLLPEPLEDVLGFFTEPAILARQQDHFAVSPHRRALLGCPQPA